MQISTCKSCDENRESSLESAVQEGITWFLFANQEDALIASEGYLQTNDLYHGHSMVPLTGRLIPAFYVHVGIGAYGA